MAKRKTKKKALKGWSHRADTVKALSDAETGQDVGSGDWWRACGTALTAMLHTAEEEGAESTRDLAKRFGRVCMKSTLRRRHLRGAPHAPRVPRDLRGYRDALPAGGPVFDMDGTDLGEKSLKGHKYGRGNNCVYDKNGKLVRCFAKMETAREVARGFGSGFYAKGRK